MNKRFLIDEIIVDLFVHGLKLNFTQRQGSSIRLRYHKTLRTNQNILFHCSSRSRYACFHTCTSPFKVQVLQWTAQNCGADCEVSLKKNRKKNVCARKASKSQYQNRKLFEELSTLYNTISKVAVRSLSIPLNI